MILKICYPIYNDILCFKRSQSCWKNFNNSAVIVKISRSMKILFLDFPNLEIFRIFVILYIHGIN